MTLLLLLQQDPAVVPATPTPPPTTSAPRPVRPRPAVTSPSNTSNVMYDFFPEWMRILDAEQSAGGGLDRPLLRLVSLVGDQLGEVDDTIDRFIPFNGYPSDLIDPYAAEEAWLAWQSQLSGADITTIPDVGSKRAAIDGSSSGWAAGRNSALAAAVREKLTGSRWVEIANHVGGNAFHIAIQTYAKETPDPAAILQAVTSAKAKPAGFRLDYQTLTGASYTVLQTYHPGSYVDLAATFPTYDTMTNWTP